MAHVPYVRAEDAPASIARVLESFEEEHGKRSLLLEALANHPPLLQAHSEYFDGTVKQGRLDQDLKELVGVVVSQVNDCEYCLDSHRENLVEMFGVSPDAVAAVEASEFDSFPADRRAALEFAELAATDPKRISQEELDALREAGFDDAAIVELLGAVGQFVTANLYADALSIHPTDRDR